MSNEVTRAAQRLKAALKEKFEPAADTRVAAKVGADLVAIRGQFAPGAIDGDAATVVNVGRPSAARYAATTGGSGTSSSSSSSSTTTTGVTIGDVASQVASAIAVHEGKDFVKAHITSSPDINLHKTYYSVNFGIAGGTGTDESNNIQLMLNRVGAAGGGVVVISATNYLDPVIQIDKVVSIYYDNVHVVFDPATKISFGATASLRIMGSYDEIKPIPGTPNTSGKLSVNSSVNGSNQTTLTLAAGKIGYFSVGQKLAVRGLNDVGGRAIQKDTTFIASIAGNVITCTDEMDYTFQPTYTTGSSPISSSDWPADATTGTTINTVTYALFTASTLAAGSVSAQVNSLTGFSIGDLVQVGDNRTEHDTNASALKSGGTPYANPSSLEMARIIGFNLTAGDSNVVYFDRATVRPYLSANYGGIARLVPVRNSSISGARISYHAHQSSTSYHALSMTYAENCAIYDCIVDGYTYVDGTKETTAGSNLGNFINDYGRCGNGIRIAYSYNCIAYRNVIRDCACFNSGQGYGYTLYYSTACYIFDCVASGCRHNYLHQLATQCGIYGCESRNHLISGFDYHGVNSDGCWLDNFVVTQVNGSTGDSSIASGVRVGNTSHSNGDQRITVTNGKFFYNAGASDIAFDFIPASSNVTFRNLEVYNANIGVKFTLNSSQVTPVQTATNIKIIDVEFVKCTGDRPFKLQATPTQTGGVSTGKIDGLFISNVIDDGNNRHLEIVGTGANGINNVHIDNYMVINSVSTPTAHLFGLDLSNIAGLSVRSCDLTGCSKGINLTNCTGPARILNNTILGLVDGAQYAYVDGGGNTSAFIIGNYLPDQMAFGGVSSPTGTELIETSGSGSGISLIDRALSSWPGSTVAGNRYVVYPNAGNLYIYTDVAGNLFTLSSAGNLTILGALAVASITSSGTITANNQIFSTGSGAGFVLYNRATNAQSVQWYSPTAGEIRLFNHNAGGDKFTLDNSGNLTLPGTINTGRAVKHTKITAAFSGSQTTANPMAHNNSAPTQTDGAQMVTTSYTPNASGNKILVRARVPYVSTSLAGELQMSLWQGSTCIGMTSNHMTSGAGSGNDVWVEGEFTSSGITAVAIEARMGPDVITMTLTWNAKFGTASNSLAQPYMTIDEYV